MGTLHQTTIFTSHAFDRVTERLSLTHMEVAAILDQDFAVPIGIDPFSNRPRRVFYSVPDRQFFVAVQDVSEGAVVTVLPLEYHANLRWPIREKHLIEAARLLGQVPPDLQGAVGVIPKVPRTALRISYSTAGADGVRQIKSLGSWPAASAPEDLSLLAHDASFVEAMIGRLRDKGASMAHQIILHVRLGKDGEREHIELDSAIESIRSKKIGAGERPVGDLRERGLQG